MSKEIKNTLPKNSDGSFRSQLFQEPYDFDKGDDYNEDDSDEDCKIVSIKPDNTYRTFLSKLGFTLYASEFDEDEDYEINKVLPKGTTYRKVFKLEKLKGECFGCCEPNIEVSWVQNTEHDFFELKNACSECFDSGVLIGDDFL